MTVSAHDIARVLTEALSLQPPGGYADTNVFLMMSRQRLGERQQARQELLSFDAWLNSQTFPQWQERVGWKMLHEEARALILTMPSAD